MPGLSEGRSLQMPLPPLRYFVTSVTVLDKNKLNRHKVSIDYFQEARRRKEKFPCYEQAFPASLNLSHRRQSILAEITV